jgi:hypothetical protein
MKINYQARTKEEFEDLEEKTNRFFRNFVLDMKREEIRVSRDLTRSEIQIYPSEHGKIKEIYESNSESKSRLIESSPTSVILAIEKTNYQIFYNPASK